MKNFLKAVACVAAFAAFSAHATTYDFSYTFNDTSAITGRLEGNLNGSVVDNISDVHVFMNGTEFNGGPLFHTAWNASTHAWDNTINAIVSTNAALNNFLFSDADVPTDFNLSNYFYFINDAASGIGQDVFATNFNTGAYAGDNPANASWSLVVSPVQLPEPSSWAMLLGGLFLLGAAKRRQS